MTYPQIRLRHLKVKIKSLAEEARIIRKEERKTLDAWCRITLHVHRIWHVRREARASQLAYAFLRGKPYKSAEPNARIKLDLERVTKIACKFGKLTNYESMEARVLKWINDA